MSAIVKIFVYKFFEVYLLDRSFLSTKDLFIKNCLVEDGYFYAIFN
jgi:hypothetical protein